MKQHIVHVQKPNYSGGIAVALLCAGAAYGLTSTLGGFARDAHRAAEPKSVCVTQAYRVQAQATAGLERNETGMVGDAYASARDSIETELQNELKQCERDPTYRYDVDGLAPQ